MNNNDLLLRLRYALDIKDTDIVKAFELGGLTVTKEEEKDMLKKITNQAEEQDEFEKNTYVKPINNQVLDSFLNGFIILKRGPQKNKSTEAPQVKSNQIRHINNILLKKVKIAL
ncbi:MAG: DUF1456 family protein, partial [Enterococcus sp.]